MEIRESLTGEQGVIAELHRAAFGAEEGPELADLVVDLLSDPTAQPLLSLVAIDDGAVVGHVIFSHVIVEGSDAGVSIMAPLAVAPDRQRSGIGTRLIEQGLAMLAEQGKGIVLVYGDPAYYSRTGFGADHNLKPPHELRYPREAWMAQELQPGALATTVGTVRCAAALNDPKHW